MITGNTFPPDDQVGGRQGAILFGDGQGGFTLAEGDRPNSEHSRESFFADFNGDGILDIFISDHGYDTDPFPGFTNQLLLGTGTGFIDVSDRLPQDGDFSHNSAVGDIDGDGDLDIIVANAGTSAGGPGPYALINDGEANFTQTTSVLPSDYVDGIVDGVNFQTFGVDLQDLNDDGLPDLVIGASGFENSVESRIYWNEGGSFSSDNFTSLPTLDTGVVGGAMEVTDIQFGDFDGDGNLDIIMTGALRDGGTLFGRGIQYLSGDGNGNFTDESLERLAPPLSQQVKVKRVTLPWWISTTMALLT